MNIVRNCIDIIGISSEEQLPKNIKGQIIEVSEIENLIIDNNVNIKNIYQIIIESSIKKTRIINTPISRIAVIDVIKKFKIAYYDDKDNMGIIEINSPYNTFFDLENNKTEVDKIEFYIVDAYFELLKKNVLYNYLLYMIDVHYLEDIDQYSNKNYHSNSIKYKLNNLRKINNTDYVQMNIEKEISIAEEKDVSIDEENKYSKDLKNELIDLEAEYL